MLHPPRGSLARAGEAEDLNALVRELRKRGCDPVIERLRALAAAANEQDLAVGFEPERVTCAVSQPERVTRTLSLRG